MWGYSGGAAAIGWAAALQPSYAPDINLAGAAHGGTPANLTAAAVYLNGSGGAGCKPIVSLLETSNSHEAHFSVVAVSFFGLGAAYPAFKARINELATPLYATVIDYVTSHCALDVVQKYSGTDFFSNGSYFAGDSAVLQDSTIRVSLTISRIYRGRSLS